MKPRLVGLVGDVLVDRASADSAFALIREPLERCGVLFGNCEGVYTTTPHFAPSASVPTITHPSNATALAVFDVLSMANNHIVDAGHQAMLETAEHLRAHGVIPVGAGRNLEEARRAAIVDLDGIRIGFLAYASVFPFGYEARSNWPGIAPMRAYNHFVDLFPNHWSPGTPPRVQTVPVEEDIAQLREDLQRTRGEADVVIASFHWGDVLRPYVLTDHEVRTARFCIDHGADAVVGHHHHVLRGMEWYRGKPIFYGLGHFVFDFPVAKFPPFLLKSDISGPASGTYYGLYPQEGWPLLPMHPDARMTALAWLEIADDGIRGAGFLPCRLNPEGQVYPVHVQSAEGAELVDYVRRCCSSQGLAAELVVDPTIGLGGMPTVRMKPLC